MGLKRALILLHSKEYGLCHLMLAQHVPFGQAKAIWGNQVVGFSLEIMKCPRQEILFFTFCSVRTFLPQN